MSPPAAGAGAGPAGEPFPAAVRTPLSEPTAARVTSLWRELGLDDATLHDEDVQRGLRDVLADRAGEEWRRVCARVRRLLDTPPHLALVSVAGPPSPPVLAALSVCLGRLEDPYRRSWSRLMQEIVFDSGFDDNIAWHVDSPGWPRTNELTGLLCVTPAGTGGRTEILPWTAIARELESAPELRAELATRKIPWVLDEALGSQVVHQPVIGAEGIRFMRSSLERAATAHPRDAHWITSLCRLFTEVADRARPYLSHRLEQGEILVFDNRRCLHRRGPVRAGDGADRLLIRTRIGRLAWRRDVGAPFADDPGERRHRSAGSRPPAGREE
ncbi:TauD/TfdA family dioxygenase [Actinomadura sp. NPDC047616]|uniref:TauD/TfdA family dioxygenase n=1 Tax=Actinomadura sp. NPDC047616 TaxID=3155914 RepID=UPI0033E90DFB